ncbi:hypothetical protein SCLCIDRAFT_1192150, partial [Scleroderma citrinum Foug A]
PDPEVALLFSRSSGNSCPYVLQLVSDLGAITAALVGRHLVRTGVIRQRAANKGSKEVSKQRLSFPVCGFCLHYLCTLSTTCIVLGMDQAFDLD